MDSNRSKICEKKNKLAELKLSKILHKIESYKLNSYFVSRLDTSGCKSPFSLKRVLAKKHVFVALIAVLIVGLWKVYSESINTVSSNSIFLYLCISTYS